jgi:eukaryotic-like serine/threonine-protein kinase
MLQSTHELGASGFAPGPSSITGSFVAGHRILRELGRGCMGTVYLAEHLRSRRLVAIKVLSRGCVTEVWVAKRLAHPNVAHVLEAGELDDGCPYLVMQLVDGVAVSDELERRGRFDILRACTIGADVARAIGAAHRVGIVHRDLKSQNVMLERSLGRERAVLLDFGIAADLLAPGRTRPGLVIGTPETMAPEQGQGWPVTTAFDVYAWGVLMFEMLSGRVPFVGPVPAAVLVHKAHVPAPSLAQRRTDVPAALGELVDACLAIEPGARPASMCEIIERIEAICAALDGTPATASISTALSCDEERRVLGHASAGTSARPSAGADAVRDRCSFTPQKTRATNAIPINAMTPKPATSRSGS